jgi:transcriptional regulator of arginine metabolism
VTFDETTKRRETIRALIRNERIATQEELRQLLEGQGYDVTQATLSRDLQRLAARRVSLPEGGSVYELTDAPVLADDSELQRMRAMVMAVLEGDALCVVQTSVGAASPVAIALDKARLPEVLGTLAGDDTIFVAPRKGFSAAKLKKKLLQVWA